MKSTKTVVMLAVALVLGGCASGTTNVNPNPEPSLKKTPKQFAEYAIGREYPATQATRAGVAPMRAEIDYQLDVVNIVNLGNESWTDVEVWLNGRYVCLLGNLPVKQQKGINFEYFYDRAGNRAPTQGIWIEQIELHRAGQIYNLPFRPAD